MLVCCAAELPPCRLVQEPDFLLQHLHSAFFAALFRSLAASLAVLKAPCHGPAVLQRQTVCFTPGLAVLVENMSHHWGSTVPAEMVRDLPAGSVYYEDIGTLQLAMIFV